MKRFLLLLFLGVSISLSAQDTIRIMTLNTHQGTDTTLQAIGEFIRSYHPDLVALQELDQWPDRPEAPKQKGKNFIAELSYHSDMMGVFGKAWDHPGGWDYGNGILSKYPIERTETVILPHHKSDEPRVLLMAFVNVKGHNFCFASTHLCYKNHSNRVSQLKKVRQVMKKQKSVKRIVCGDMNENYTDGLVPSVMKKWKDALPEEGMTFNAYDEIPTMKYDYILYDSSNVKVINSFIVCDGGISDHCAGIVDIVLK